MITSEETYAHQETSVSKDEKTWGMLCHISAFAGFVFPFGNIIAPLVIWLLKKDEMPFVDDQAKEVLNFQITVIIYLVISLFLMLVLIGIAILAVLGIFDLIVTIVGAIKANEGFRYRYPATIRFIK